MGTITFNLPDGREAVDIYEDTAIVDGYKNTITEAHESGLLTEAELANYVFPEGAEETSRTINSYTQTDASVLYKIHYKVTVPNPITLIEHGEQIVKNMFAKEDAILAGKALETRMKTAYNI